jgi:hypothetical protein
LGDYARDEEETQYVTVHDPFALVPSTSTILARASMEDTDVLNISPIRTCYGEITQGERLGKEQSEWVQ